MDSLLVFILSKKSSTNPPPPCLIYHLMRNILLLFTESDTLPYQFKPTLDHSIMDEIKGFEVLTSWIYNPQKTNSFKLYTGFHNQDNNPFQQFYKSGFCFSIKFEFGYNIHD